MSLILGLIPAITDLIDRIIPDPTQKAEAKLALLKEENAAALVQIQSIVQEDSAQNAVNQEEAKDENLFKSGARPFILWVCGVAFAYKFIAQPFLIFLLIACGSNFDYHKLPTLDWTELSTVMFGMLGLGYMRTKEKLG